MWHDELSLGSLTPHLPPFQVLLCSNQHMQLSAAALVAANTKYRHLYNIFTHFGCVHPTPNSTHPLELTVFLHTTHI